MTRNESCATCRAFFLSLFFQVIPLSRVAIGSIEASIRGECPLQYFNRNAMRRGSLPPWGLLEQLHDLLQIAPTFLDAFEVAQPERGRSRKSR